MKRFIFSDNGTLLDKTIELEDYHTGVATIDYTATEDAIYLGSELPFNSLFISLSSANSIASVFSVSHWNGNSWASMVEIKDETVGLTQSGYLTWVPSKDETWQAEDTEEITGLTTLTIYDLYWLKLTMSATLAPSTSIKWIGSKFCSDDDLTNEYTLFANTTFRSNYKSGKTSWENEIILASRLIVDDLEKRRVIEASDQLLIRRRLIDACVSKAAQIIFKNLGDDYKDDAEKAKKEYYERLNKSNYGTDLNNNARVESGEKKAVTGVFYQ